MREPHLGQLQTTFFSPSIAAFSKVIIIVLVLLNLAWTDVEK